MTKPPIPRFASDVTPEWMTELLDELDLVSDAQVTDVEIEPLGVGTSFVASVMRTILTYKPPNAGTPSFVMKLANPAPPDLQLNRLLLEREGRFYDELAESTPLRMPRCYWNVTRPTTDEFVLMLEDRSDLRVGDPGSGCSAAEAELIVSELARMQARWWGDERLTRLPWLKGLDARTFGMQSEDDVSSFAQTFSDIAPDGFGRSLALAAQSWTALTEPLSGLPPTLVHGDFRLENMLFSEDAGERPVVLDWQFVCLGSGRWDLRYFLAQNLPPDLRKEIEYPLLEVYHQTLVDEGVSGYSLDQCHEDYRLGLLLALSQPIGMEKYRRLNTRRLDELSGDKRDRFAVTARGFAELQRRMAERNVAAIVDNDAFAALP